MTPKTPAEILCQTLKSSSVECLALTEDGSNRQYFRVQTVSQSPTYILMQLQGQDAFDLKQGSYSWITIGSVLQKEHIFAPRIHTLFKDYDSLLIEDFGDTTLDIQISQSNDAQIQKLYKTALEMQAQFLSIKPDLTSSWPKRGFDYTLLHRELEFFKNQYLENVPEFEKHKNNVLFSKEIESLSRYILKLPQFFTHRDFHSRNLMFFQNTLGVIDFQDARWGPAAYDLCSLCFDPYVTLSIETRKKIFAQALQIMEDHHGAKLRDSIEGSWHAVLLQRMLKAIGSFAFLTRKGKRNYRVHIEPTLSLLNQILPADSQWTYLVNELIPLLLTFQNEKKA